MRKAASAYFHPSNAVTYVSVLGGLLAVAAAKEWRSWSAASALLALSAPADTLDGRFARRFHRDPDQKRFGVELDSLADAVTFGLVPVVAIDLLVTFGSPWIRVVWIGAALFHLMSALTRLGFYDLHHTASAGFVGLPTTVAALVWSSVFLAAPPAWATVVVLVGVGIAMVSNLPVPRPRGLRLVAFGGWAAALVVGHVAAGWWGGGRLGGP
jgi:CDP-diacylglycerol--serine O-phosphatidyltransferase